MTPSHHLVVVEAYDGILECLSGDPRERAAARGLGLPLDAIANALDARITVLTWDDWLEYELRPEAFFNWVRHPATRGVRPPGPAPAVDHGPRVRTRPIPARDPDHGRSLHASSPSPMAFGILAESDPLALLGVVLHQSLENLFQEDPFDLVMVPVWGGCGYHAQMLRAIDQTAIVTVPFVAVVTGTSRTRQLANGEGLWTRPAIIRRQLEDMSLALADGAVVFGPLGMEVANRGRLPGASPAAIAPRHVPARVIASLAARNTDAGIGSRAARVVLHEPLDGASGVLAALDAATVLARDAATVGPVRIHCTGPSVVFAPMKPRVFAEYWSSRASVGALVSGGHWSWDSPDGPAASGPIDIRLYPSRFEHLPSPWIALVDGSLPVLSAAAAEGLGEDVVPDPCGLGADPGPQAIADAVRTLVAAGPAVLAELHRDFCSGIARDLGSHSGGRHERLLKAFVDSIAPLLTRAAPQPLGAVAQMLRDRTLPLSAAPSPTAAPPERPETLSVVVTCHNMGAMVTSTVESVWASTRMPDQLIVVDDGSDDPETRRHLDQLAVSSAATGRPLRIVRQANAGLAKARNAGLAQASGAFVSFLDGDDLIEPDFYRVALSACRANPELGGVAAWAICFGDGIPDAFWNPPQPEFPLLLVENTVIVPCMMPTDVVRSLGGFEAAQRYNYEDWELSIRMLGAGYPIVTIPRYLQRYRVRPDSLYRTMTDAQNQAMRELMLERHRELANRFGVEMVMQVEHRLMQRIHDRAVASGSSGFRLVDQVRALLARLRH